MNDLQELMSIWQQVEIQEKKKLDPVGQEDGDIDNDGDTDSSDEYLKNRRKKVSSSVKSQKDEDCDCDATEEKEPKKKVSKKEGYGTKKESTASYGASQQKIADKKKKDAMSSSDKNKLGKLADLMKKEGKMECPKCKGDGCSHCDDKGYHMKESTQIDEISRSTVGSALEKRVAELKKNKEDDTKTWDQIVAAQKKGDKKSYDRLMKDADKLERTREKLRRSIQKLSNDMEFGQRESTLDASLFSQEELSILEKAAGEEFGSTASKGETKFYKDHQKSDPKLATVGDHENSDKAGKVTKQSAARNAADNLNNGDSKTAGKL